MSGREGMGTVYPRSRGEHHHDKPQPFQSRGLSPLTRGTQLDLSISASLHRFIPAHAGNTPLACPKTPHYPVYPRSRGEHPLLFASSIIFPGLSPLTRGTPRAGIQDIFVKGFIPAHAGNTFKFLVMVNFQPVYPRSRGEHLIPETTNETGCGLSPLTRGTHMDIRTRWPGRRFIPAHAGNTFLTGTSTWARAVYPRSRGEHYINHERDILTGGLSPLTRGTQLPGGEGYRAQRFIPAHAGNTLKLSD